jgi:hypothetical protein
MKNVSGEIINQPLKTHRSRGKVIGVEINAYANVNGFVSFAHFLSTEIRKSDLTGESPAIVVINRLPNIVPADSMREIVNEIKPMGAENTYALDIHGMDERKEREINASKYLRSAARSVSVASAVKYNDVFDCLRGKFDFVIVPIEANARTANVQQCDIILQVTSIAQWCSRSSTSPWQGTDLGSYHSHVMESRTQGASLIVVDSYRYAFDTKQNHIYDFKTYEKYDLPLKVSPSPFATAIMPSSTYSSPEHTVALNMLMRTIMEKKVSASPFVMTEEETAQLDNLYQEKVDAPRVLTRNVRRWTGASIFSFASFISLSPVLYFWLEAITLGQAVPLAAVTGGATGLFASLSAMSFAKRKKMSSARQDSVASVQNRLALTSAESGKKTPETLSQESRIVETPPAPTPEWDMLFDRYQAVVDAWLDYEVDLMKTLEYPLMSDITCIHTANFHRAMNNAQMYKPNTIPATPVSESPFFKAVQDLEIAFTTAEAYAKKNKWQGLSASDQNDLASGKKMLALALDQNASIPERQTAYKAARAKVEHIIYLPERAIASIEKSVLLEIEA